MIDGNSKLCFEQVIRKVLTQCYMYLTHSLVLKLDYSSTSYAYSNYNGHLYGLFECT